MQEESRWIENCRILENIDMKTLDYYYRASRSIQSTTALGKLKEVIYKSKGLSQYVALIQE